MSKVSLTFTVICLWLFTGCTLSLDIHGTAVEFASKSAPKINKVSADVSNISAVSNLSLPRFTTAQIIPITVEFNQSMVVTGNPTLELSTGSVNRKATYASGSGTNQLVFEYTVVAGDSATTLDYTNSSAIDLNGGDIVPAAGTSEFAPEELTEFLKLPNPGDQSSLAGTTPMLIKTTPEVKSLKSPETDVYLDGNALEVVVKYDQPVAVTGAPRIEIKIASNTRIANFISQISDRELLFRYVVIIGDNDTNGIELPASISLNGGSIVNPANEAAVIALPSEDTTEVLTYTSPLTASFVTSTQVVSESVGSIQIPVVLSMAAPIPFKVSITSLGDATSGDFELDSRDIQFGIGDTVKYITVRILDDSIPEPEKRLRLVLSKNSLGNGGVLAMTEINIRDDDSVPPTLVDYQSGSLFACALYSNRELKCLGENDFGYLGNGTTVPSDVVTATPVMTDVQSYTVGALTTCAVNSLGEMWCWGKDPGGVIPSFTGGMSTTPKKLVSSGAVKPVLGTNMFCYIATNKDLKCWGSDNQALGNPAPAATKTVPFASPIVVMSGVEDAWAVRAAAGLTMCALKSNGGVPAQNDLYCWGYLDANNFTGGNLFAPPATAQVENVKSISLGYSRENMCVQSEAGSPATVKNFCWGTNIRLSLTYGVGSPSSSSTTPLEMSATYRDYMVAATSICGIKETDGSVWCWGNTGDTPGATGATPSKVVDSGAVRFLAASASSAAARCVLTDTGSVVCWQVSTTSKNKLTPQTVIASGVKAIGIGGHQCVVMTSGELDCWGANANGQIGDRTTNTRQVPTQIFSRNVTQVAANSSTSSTTCAVSSYGELRCWGKHSSKGSLGAGATAGNIVVPKIIVDKDIQKVWVANDRGCAISTGGALLCWGDNSTGQTKPGTVVHQMTPNTVLSSGVADVAMMYNSICYLNTDGEVRCWGINTNGELGVGNTTNQSTIPLDPILTDVKQIFGNLGTAGSLGCAIKENSDLYCWGKTYSVWGTTSFPQKIMSDVKDLAIGQGSFCAVVGDDRALKCWGQNSSGEVGNGLIGNVLWSAPYTVLTSGVKSVSSGGGGLTMCFIMMDSGELRCMGDDSGGLFATGERSAYARTIPGL
ncbi:Calx-beta domain-containing protein [Bdellovibrio sp. GT3]|uniref:Calx-beta domain-containing protein n=1 Tax=Bdellovibrio sp. GT3 TaxID=3136282 RepID=UPI0030F216DB